ncbi:UNVERIFIED_CONTAM: Wall-associated receptor kinase [Sesamum latifolium]|uniref:Wall-associated receptor kinase n=1 Tax=Sesamum latifolium TaxID=2727402 RepID=A0AAW2W7Y2_9LAMI
MGIIILLLAASWLYLGFKRRSFNKMKQKFFLQNGGTLLLEKLHARGRSLDTMKIFTSSELKKATNDFNNNMIVGQGGFGTVYKGFLPDNSIVAIKKSKRIDPHQVEQFINEVLVLSQINHRNVVRLLGCCLETEVPLLVYEFVSNGTLSSHIHNQARARFLSWDIRLRIAAEAAGVLSYLHSAAATPIIHRDVKSDNILLDNSFTAKVSDFGASKLVPLDHTQLSTMVQGTFGYLDPEYMQTNKLTEKSDVYSFGVVLLELLTGRKAVIFDKPEEEKNLANFFLSVLKQERLFQVVDDNILGDDRNIREQIIEVAKLAQGCLNVKGEERPSMKEVTMELEGLRHGGKHSWAQTESNSEEMESFFGGGYSGISIDSHGDSTSVGFDSLRNDVVSPMSGGR